MKKILAIVVALCMLMPLVAFGETAQDVMDGKAMVTEVTFVPGTLPEDLAPMQTLYADLLGALSIKSLAQEADGASYEILEMLIGGERVFGFDVLMAGETLSLISEFLGDKPVAVTKDELLKLVSDIATAEDATSVAQLETMINAVFSGDLAGMEELKRVTGKDAAGHEAEFTALLTDLAAIMAPYMEKAVITEGEVKSDRMDDGVMTVELDISNEEIHAIWPLLGTALGKSETVSNALVAAFVSQGAEMGDMTFEEMWNAALLEIPDTMNYKYVLVFDADALPVYVDMAICDGEEVVLSTVYERLTQNDATNHLVLINVVEDGEATLAAGITLAIASDESAAGIDFQVGNEMLVSFIVQSNQTETTPATEYAMGLTAFDLTDAANANEPTVAALDLGLIIETEEGEEGDTYRLSFLMDGTELIGIVAKTSLVDAVALPEVKDAVHIATLNETDMQTFLGTVMQNALVVLSNALTMLPESVTTVIMSLMGAQAQ